MRITRWMAAVSALVGATFLGHSGEGSPPPGAEAAQVAVNSQESLRDAVGEGFQDHAWEYPSGLLPKSFVGLIYSSGPSDAGLSPKARWRTPIVFNDKNTGVKLSINCYHRREKEAANSALGTPAASLLEPDYGYQKSEFHGLPAATASIENRYVSVFRDGDRLFKIEATGGKTTALREAVAAVAEAIWMFHHSK